jgi:hypothetical protein
MKEVWKNIKEFDGYQISSMGNVKSLSRIILKNGKYPSLTKEKILKPKISNVGYQEVNLSKNGKTYMRSIHQLIAVEFLNHTPCGLKLVINHIDYNKLNNNIFNLEIVTNRENSYHKHKNVSSQFIGVHFDRKRKKWISKIWIANQRIYLGSFDKEESAGEAYIKALNNYNEQKEILELDKIKQLCITEKS